MCSSCDSALAAERLVFWGNRGHPFAKAEVYGESCEYLVFISRGAFYAFKKPSLRGDVRGILASYVSHRLRGKPFSLKLIRDLSLVMYHYGVSLKTFKNPPDVILFFENTRSSHVSADVLFSDRGFSGEFDLSSKNTAGLGLNLDALGSFDSLNMYLKTSADLVWGLLLRGSLLRTDTVFHLLEGGVHTWRGGFRFLVGIGTSSRGRYTLLGLTSRGLDSYFRIALSDYGYEVSLQLGKLNFRLYKGVFGLVEPIGGRSGLREYPMMALREDFFLLIKADNPFGIGNVYIGPYADILIGDMTPTLSYGLSIRVGPLHAFISTRGSVGFGFTGSW